MAKPRFPFDLVSTATSSSSHANQSASSTTRRRARIKLPPRPSSNLIALLATVAASSSTADGRPLSSDPRPPEFLCPFLSPRLALDRPSSSRQTLAELTEEEQAEDFYGYSVTPTRVRRVGSAVPDIPDKYTQGTDGRWRKVDSWTLYGSTYCDCSTSSSGVPQITGPIQEEDDQAGPTQLPSASSASPTPTDMTADLPPGWNRTLKKEAISQYIPILAVFLALFICALIFGCVAWRRKRRGMSKDLEKKPYKQRLVDDDSDMEIDEKQRARAQQRRLWVKATARFRPNIKLAARRRRKRASTSSSTGGSTYPTASRRASFTDDARSAVTLHGDDPSSSSAVEMVSTSYSAAPSLDLQRPDAETPCSGERRPLPDDISHEEEPILPPDYPNGASSQAVNSTERLISAGGTLPLHMSATFSSDNRVSTAHIATDDKNLLARMAAFVSSPPTDDRSAEDPSHCIAFGPGPSVPVIDELEAESVAELGTMESNDGKGPAVVWSNNLSPSSSSLRPSLAVSPVPTYSREPSPQPPLFPAPPSKAQFVTSGFYEYPSLFENDALNGDDFRSPAPPFGPSAPDHDSSIDMNAVPCAPPLIDEEDELQLGLGPSAPPLPPEEAEDSRIDTGSPSGRVSRTHRVHVSPSPQIERTLSSPPDYLP